MSNHEPELEQAIDRLSVGCDLVFEQRMAVRWSLEEIRRLRAELEVALANRQAFQVDMLSANSRLADENSRLRALNAKLVVALESLLRWTETSETTKAEGKAEHDDVVKGRARAALAEAREPQQPPQGLVSGTA